MAREALDSGDGLLGASLPVLSRLNFGERSLALVIGDDRIR